MHLLATDTTERIRDGRRRSIVTFMDPVSPFAFAWAVASQRSRHSAHALTLALSLLGWPWAVEGRTAVRPYIPIYGAGTRPALRCRD